MIILIGFLLVYSAASAQPANMVKIKGGTYVPLYDEDTTAVPIGDFLIDMYPVTNTQFRAFVQQNVQWKRTNVKRIFADQSYLRHWTSDTNFRPESKESPVTYVSWFAAKAYCECQHKRLPTVDEWEYLSMASETKANASGDTQFNQYILSWHSKPNPATFLPVKKSFKNYYGVYGIHGLVWEWVLDFNSALMTSESRANASLDKQLFCAGGSIGVSDTRNYVAFLRYAFRSSLKADYTVSNLGFRCAKSIQK